MVGIRTDREQNSDRIQLFDVQQSVGQYSTATWPVPCPYHLSHPDENALLRGLPVVAVVQPADHRAMPDRSNVGSFHRPGHGTILRKAQMRTTPVVVLDVASQDTAEMPIAENDHMIEALPSHCPDEALHVWILPR